MLLNFLLLFFIFHIIIINCNIINKSICNSDNHKYLGPFLVQRWLDARVELGLYNYPIDDQFYYSNLINNVTSLYLYHSGAIVTHNGNGLVPYARIYKCGNEAIGYNLGLILL